MIKGMIKYGSDNCFAQSLVLGFSIYNVKLFYIVRANKWLQHVA